MSIETDWQIIPINPFLHYFSDSNLGHLSVKFESIILENIKQVSRNAFTLNDMTSHQVYNVVPLSLNIKTLKFLPQQSIPTLQRFIPVYVTNALGLGSDKDISNSSTHITDFFDFLIAHLTDLRELKVGEEKESMTIHLLRQYKSLETGLFYLSKFYQNKGSPVDEKAILNAQKSLECLGTTCGLVEGLNSNQTSELTGAFLSLDLSLLELERYAPLKKAMEIDQQRLGNSKIQRKFIQGENFLAACLRMKKEELNHFCAELMTLNKEMNSDHLLAYLLSDARFSSLHEECLTKLLRHKSCLETQEQFDHRAKTEPVQKALTYIQNKINELKPQLNHGELLIELLKAFLKSYYASLAYYQPFQRIFNFVFCHPHTPKMNRYPSLPLKNIGENDFLTCVVHVLLAVDNPHTLDISTKEGRLILLKSAEFLFLKPANFYQGDFIDKSKLGEWAKAFPEFSQFPKIKASIENLSSIL